VGERAVAGSRSQRARSAHRDGGPRDRRRGGAASARAVRGPGPGARRPLVGRVRPRAFAGSSARSPGAPARRTPPRPRHAAHAGRLRAHMASQARRARCAARIGVACGAGPWRACGPVARLALASLHPRTGGRAARGPAGRRAGRGRGALRHAPAAVSRLRPVPLARGQRWQRRRRGRRDDRTRLATRDVAPRGRGTCSRSVPSRR
jgi:hypothetical protein